MIHLGEGSRNMGDKGKNWVRQNERAREEGNEW